VQPAGPALVAVGLVDQTVTPSRTLSLAAVHTSLVNAAFEEPRTTCIMYK